MPAPEVTAFQEASRPILGHVNLMIDTYIANATADELRSAVRGLLASGTPGIASAFSAAARKHLCQSGALSTEDTQSFFVEDNQTGNILPTETLERTLARARAVYGAGMGFESLPILTGIVEATIGATWAREGDTANLLIAIDADIVQAIQSCKEEIEAGLVSDRELARQTVNKLRVAINQCTSEITEKGGECPFEKASWSIDYWKL